MPIRELLRRRSQKDLHADVGDKLLQVRVHADVVELLKVRVLIAARIEGSQKLCERFLIGRGPIHRHGE